LYLIARIDNRGELKMFVNETMSGQNQSGYATEGSKRVPEAAMRMEQLEKRLHVLRETSSHLEERLGKVLLPAQPAGLIAGKNSADSRSPMAEHIERLDRLAEDAEMVLRGVLDRLDI
jgi:hypothetical protein